ncbi:MAG: hypothetical protein RML49_03650 [Verrucomicrobiae bacterium]|nr:hypothetical protein [Verrucomicrobiae bacterium]
MKDDRWLSHGRTQALEVMPLPKLFTPDITPIALFSFDSTGEPFFTGGVAGANGVFSSPA